MSSHSTDPTTGRDAPLTPAEARERLTRRFEDGKPSLWVREGWLPYLAQLDEAVAAEVPDYQLSQAKEKFGYLRYYIDVNPTPPCCRSLLRELDDQQASEEQADAALVAHEATPAHQERAARYESAWDRAAALIQLSELASTTW